MPPKITSISANLSDFPELSNPDFDSKVRLNYQQCQQLKTQQNTMANEMNALADWEELRAVNIENLESKLVINQDGTCCININTIDTNVTGSSLVVLDHELTLSISASSLLQGVEIVSYSIDWGDGSTTTSATSSVSHTYTTGVIGDQFTITIHAIDDRGNRGESVTHIVTVSSMYIDTPTFTIDVDEYGKVSKNPIVTLAEFPTIVGTTNSIDSVILDVIKKNDGSLIREIIETDMTLPIEIESPNLEVSTEYYFRLKCRIEADDLDSNFAVLEKTTKDNFLFDYDMSTTAPTSSGMYSDNPATNTIDTDLATGWIPQDNADSREGWIEYTINKKIYSIAINMGQDWHWTKIGIQINDTEIQIVDGLLKGDNTISVVDYTCPDGEYTLKIVGIEDTGASTLQTDITETRAVAYA